MRALTLSLLLLIITPISAADIIITTDKNPGKKYILTIKDGKATLVLAKVTTLPTGPGTPDNGNPPTPTGTIAEKTSTLLKAVNDPDKELNSAGIYAIYKLAARRIKAKTVTVEVGLKEIKDGTHDFLVARNAVAPWAAWRRGVAKALQDAGIKTTSSPEKVAAALDQVTDGIKNQTSAYVKSSGKRLPILKILRVLMPLLTKVFSGGDIKFADIFEILTDFLGGL